MGYKIRMLTNEEFAREDLKKIFEENGGKIPVAQVSSIAIAEDENGKLLGFHTLQPVYHCEPEWIDPEVRSIYPNLHKDLMEVIIEPLKHIKGLVIYAFAPNEKISNLAKRFGFKELDWKVLEQRF